MNYFGFNFSKSQAEQPAAPAAPGQPATGNHEGAMRATDGTEIKVTKGESPTTKSCTPTPSLSWNGYELDPNLIPQKPEKTLSMREKWVQGAASLAKKAGEVGGTIAQGATTVTASVSKTYQNWYAYYTIYQDPVKTLTENAASHVINRVFSNLSAKELYWGCQLVNKQWNQFSFPCLAETIATEGLPKEGLAARLLNTTIPLKWRVAFLCTNALLKSSDVSCPVQMLNVAKKCDDKLFDKELDGINVLEIVYEKYKKNPEVLAFIVKNNDKMIDHVPDSFFSDLNFLLPLLNGYHFSNIEKKMVDLVPDSLFADVNFLLPLLKWARRNPKISERVEKMLDMIPESHFKDLKFVLTLLTQLIIIENAPYDYDTYDSYHDSHIKGILKIQERLKKLLDRIPKSCFNDIDFVITLFRAFSDESNSIIHDLMPRLEGNDLIYHPKFMVKYFFKLKVSLIKSHFSNYYKEKLGDRDFMLMAIFMSKHAFAHLSDSLKLDAEFRKNVYNEFLNKERFKQYDIYLSYDVYLIEFFNDIKKDEKLKGSLNPHNSFWI